MKKTAFQSLALMLAMLLMLSLLASCSSTKQPAETPDSDQPHRVPRPALPPG